jgi:hypothetical protein
MAHDSKPINEDAGAPPSGKIRGLGRTLRNLMFASLALMVVLNLFITPHHPHFGLEKIPGFWALFGLLGAVILAKGAKGAAHSFLGKDENFYENRSTDSREQGVK